MPSLAELGEWPVCPMVLEQLFLLNAKNSSSVVPAKNTPAMVVTQLISLAVCREELRL